jgi:CHAT domain-containing protein
VEEQIRVKSPAYAALTQPQPLNAQQIQQQLLDADSLLLEYSLGEERSYLFALTPDSLHAYQLPKRAEIEALAGQLYNGLAGRPETGNLPGKPGLSGRVQTKKFAAALSQMVLGPVAGELQGKRLIIVSDGALQYVPFAALPVPAKSEREAGSYEVTPLMVDHEIVNLPSASVLSVLRQTTAGRKQPPKAVTVFADPVFDRKDERVVTIAQKNRLNQSVASASAENQGSESAAHLNRSAADLGLQLGGPSYLPRLPFSRREAEAILSVIPLDEGMKALDFSASRELAMSPELAQYRIVHFATHGFLDNRHPEFSGLVLSLVDEHGKPRNGFLDMQDIYDLNLPAELVVLSACETGLGKQINGEGLLGLTRGFMYAGAKRVVASLWNTDDQASAEFMARFYKAMEQEKLSPAAALRQAQIDTWKKKRWSDPYYWAAFQLQGEWK